MKRLLQATELLRYPSPRMAQTSAIIDFAAVRGRLGRSLDGYSARLGQAARYLLERPDEVALHSMRSVAARAGVHPSTMVRLARALGFASYNDLRELFRGWLRDERAPFAPRARRLQARAPGGATDDLLADLIAADHANIDASFDRIAPDRLIACAAAIEAAREVYVVGLRSCFPVAFYLHYALRLVLPRVRLLDGRGGTFADESRDIGAGDAVIAVSVKPYTRETVRVVRYAAEGGATVVALTDSHASPIAADAARALVFDNAGPAILHSIVPALAVAEALVALLVARGGDDSLAALRRSEHQLHSLDAYVEAPPGARPRGSP